jgi:hypothetical protein
MNLYFSESDRFNTHRVALITIASFFDILDFNEKSNDEILNDISSLKTKSAISITKLINKYFEAYDEWFSFYKKIYKIEREAGEEYILNKKEIVERNKLIEKREISLNNLQNKFDRLQLLEKK